MRRRWKRRRGHRPFDSSPSRRPTGASRVGASVP
jgi:hypothetical protein